MKKFAFHFAIQFFGTLLLMAVVAAIFAGGWAVGSVLGLGTNGSLFAGFVTVFTAMSAAIAAIECMK